MYIMCTFAAEARQTTPGDINQLCAITSSKEAVGLKKQPTSTLGMPREGKAVV